MPLRIMTDDMGRECALDPERIELVSKCVDTLPHDGAPRTYCWQIHMRCGATHVFKMRIQAETMRQFLYRVKHGA